MDETLAMGKYTFCCRFNREGILPRFKGSTFRGVFGVALKQVVCALKTRECTDCPLNTRCLYALVFETPVARAVPADSRMNAPPHPFVIEPPATEKESFQAGDAFACDLLLFGDANAQLPYFVYAFDRIGRLGIGRRIDGKRGGFELEKVMCGVHVVYKKADEKIRANGFFDKLPRPEKTAPANADLRLKVALKTPLRLKYKNRIKADLPFHVLARAMLRRVSSLFACYAGGEPDLDYKGMLQRAEGIKTVSNHLKWHAWERFSNRQKQRMPMGGLIGSVTYEGRLGEFLQVMDICAKVHVGKNTTFGLGQLTAVIEN